jgi:hypothetical protein
VGQSDVAGDLCDYVVHGGNRRLLGVSLDVMDTFLDGLGRSLFVLYHTIPVHPLLGFPLAVTFMFTPATVRKAHSILMKTQAVPLPCFLSASGGGVVGIVFAPAKFSGPRKTFQ